MGFIETPIKVTMELWFSPHHLSAEEEEGMLISQANIQMDNSKITAENVIARQEGDFL
jgi:DNA-directed RNA polymerase subunit beta